MSNISSNYNHTHPTTIENSCDMAIKNHATSDVCVTPIRQQLESEKLSYFQNLKQKMLQSQLMSCIAGSVILWASFGVRQTFGIFLIPVTQDTGWDRSTFSTAAAVFQLVWGCTQPFTVFFAERRLGMGKSIFVSGLLYAIALLILYGSRSSSGLFIFSMGALAGFAAGGNSFPIVLASIGRRFPAQSKQQSVAFGIVSSFGSFGQVVFLPITRATIASISWEMAFIVLGVIMLATAPLAFFLQTVPAKAALPATIPDRVELMYDDNNKIDDEKVIEGAPVKDIAGVKEQDDDVSAPDIKTALREALSSPTFLMIVLGFSVCGFHVSFLGTHFPAYLQDQGIDPSLAAWTMSILGAGSMIGSICVGYITVYVSARLTLTVLYLLRTILIVIFVFIPISLTTVLVFSCLFGFLWLSTVPLTTKFVGDVFGHKYLGTLTSITFVGHQIGAFLGAFIGGVVYDQTHDYVRLWYGCLALAVLAVVVNFFAGEEPINMRRRGIA